MKNLQPTILTLFTANYKFLIVMGAMPIFISTHAVDGVTEVIVRDLMYIVEEIDTTFISRDALVDMGSVNVFFPPCLHLRHCHHY